MIKIKDKEKYYKRPNKQIILTLAQIRKDNNIVYGTHALNAYLPKFLDRKTTDYDVFSKQPLKSAKKLEKTLDKKYGADLYDVVPARHKGTHRIKNKVTSEIIVDFSKQPKQIGSTERHGIHYVTLDRIKDGIKKTLKDKSSAYRHGKDRDSLNRIKIAERNNKVVKH